MSIGNNHSMFKWDQFAPGAAAEEFWDVIVVGAGMGGSTIGYALAKRGLRVLFVERGQPATAFAFPSRWQRLRHLLNRADDAKIIAAMGRWQQKITMVQSGRTVDLYPPLGSGPGGSSALYGAALERLRRVDFSPKIIQFNAEEALPNDWPIDYDEFTKYYTEAERLFNVCGSNDPLDDDDNATLRPPPPLSERDRHFYESFRSLGLSPYRLHVGIGYKPCCTECQGVPCQRDCKADGSSAALKPALSQHGAKIILNCIVEQIETVGRRSTAVVVRIDNQVRKLRSRTVVLAAGALSTPLILLKSTSDDWPKGVGNQNDLIGRGLMFHISDFFALWPTIKADAKGPLKTLSSRAFYIADGKKFGCFQSIGVPVSQHQVYSYLVDLAQRTTLGQIPLTKLLLRIIAILAERYFINAALFATILEDFPYRYNRLIADITKPSGFYLEYRKPDELAGRVSLMRELIRKTLAPHTPFLLSQVDNINLGHPCGTCRSGWDPNTSVLDPAGRVRGVDNLYVADASFFPSSGGTNPSLTIAANALRIADIIFARIRENATS